MEGLNHTVAFDLDTEESAHEWKGELEAALFSKCFLRSKRARELGADLLGARTVFRTTADKLRLSLPLQYITRTLITPFQSLA